MRARPLTWLLVATGLLVGLLFADVLFLGIGDRVINGAATSWAERVNAPLQLHHAGYHTDATFQLEELDASFPARTTRHALDTEREQLLLGLGMAYESMGRHKKARQTLGRLVEFDPRNHESHGHLATLLIKQGRLDDAADALRDALDIHPSHLPTVARAVAVLTSTGRPGAARKVWRAYLDAVAFAEVTISHRGRAVTAAVPVDGRFHEVPFQLFAGPRDAEPMSLSTDAVALEVGESVSVTPARAGRPATLEGRAPIAPGEWQASAAMRSAGGDVYRPEGDDAALDVAVPAGGVRTLRLRVRLPVPVDATTWRTIEENHSDGELSGQLDSMRQRIILTSGGRR